MHTFFLATTFFIIGLLSGCSSAPKFDLSGVDQALTPQSVIAEPDVSFGKIALWGGTILSIVNLEETTQIEMLAYPLNSSHKPMHDKKPLGRFLIQHKGYLEPATFEQGKLLSVLGSLGKSQKGKVGESDYAYPVINARQLHLWTPGDEGPQTSFHFGLGIRL